MYNFTIEATIMIPVKQVVKASSLQEAKNKLEKEYKINRNVPCMENTTQPFIHSMVITNAEEVNPEVA